MTLIVPAVLPSSHADLDKKLSLLASLPHVSRIQIDVVDGKLAAPASWPYSAKATQPELETMVQKGEMLPELERIAYEIDLMCFDPLSAAEPWLALGASRLTFHTESAVDLSRLLSDARRRFGHCITFGLALNVASDLSIVRPCLGEIAYVQFMGIAQIGSQGQPFDKRVLAKIETFHRMYPAMPLQVDGGVSLISAKELLVRGVSTLVVGSALLQAKNPMVELQKFEALRSSYGV